MKRVGIFYISKKTFPPFFEQALQWIGVHRTLKLVVMAPQERYPQGTLGYEKIPWWVVLFLKGGRIGKTLACVMMKKKWAAYDILCVPFSLATQFKNIPLLVYCYPSNEAMAKRMARTLTLASKTQILQVVSLVSMPLAETLYVKMTPSLPVLRSSTTTQPSEHQPLPPPHTYFTTLIAANTNPGDVFYLLRSFSKFKKHTQSTLKLLIGVEDASGVKAWKLDTYYYAADVVIYEGCNLQEPATYEHLLREAYAFIYFNDTHRAYLIPEIATAMYAHCPILALQQLWTESLCEQGARYFRRERMATLVEAMKAIFADEKGRENMIKLNATRLRLDPVERNGQQVFSALQKL